MEGGVACRVSRRTTHVTPPPHTRAPHTRAPPHESTTHVTSPPPPPQAPWGTIQAGAANDHACATPHCVVQHQHCSCLPGVAGRLMSQVGSIILPSGWPLDDLLPHNFSQTIPPPQVSHQNLKPPFVNISLSTIVLYFKRRIIFIGPRYTWGPIYGSESL